MASRESGIGRFKPGVIFDELKHAPLIRGGNADAGYVPSPTGTYDYLIGKASEKDAVSWIAVNNPRSQLMFFMLTPRRSESEEDYFFPNVDLAENYLGRMDAPWALFDGATPEVRAVTLGFNTGPKGTSNLSIAPGESKLFMVGNGFMSYDNPRIGLGFYSVELAEEGIVFKRTKSWAMMNAGME